MATVTKRAGAKRKTNTRKTTASRRTKSRALATNRRRNSTTRFTRNRRAKRNPTFAGLLKGGAYAAVGAVLQGAIASVIPIQGQGIMGLILQWGSAWLAAMIGEKFLPGGAGFIAAGAAAGAAKSTFDYLIGNVGGIMSGQLIPQSMVIGGAQQPAMLPPAPVPGVNDIVGAPDYYTGFADITGAPDYYQQFA